MFEVQRLVYCSTQFEAVDECVFEDAGGLASHRVAHVNVICATDVCI